MFSLSFFTLIFVPLTDWMAFHACRYRFECLLLCCYYRCFFTLFTVVDCFCSIPFRWVNYYVISTMKSRAHNACECVRIHLMVENRNARKCYIEKLGVFLFTKLKFRFSRLLTLSFLTISKTVQQNRDIHIKRSWWINSL